MNVTVTGKRIKGNKGSTWFTLSCPPGGGEDHNRYLMVESPDSVCIQKLRPETAELYIRLLEALEGDKKHFEAEGSN